ncbi:hypothetical protein CCP3SC1AL1_110027 [Gammaproteobacteria bacterium]
MTTAIVTRGNDASAALTPQDVKNQVQLIQQVMSDVMKDGEHYGVVPGCGKKKVLLKAGAEKLSVTFRLRPVMGKDDITIMDLPNGHREYQIICHIFNMPGTELATGVGSCSSMESKYRYRRESDFEVIGSEIPKDYREQKERYRKEGFGAKKDDTTGAWLWVKYKAGDRKENPDIADTYNTVLKMAKKRAYVDGILSATGASDIFTQDLEENAEVESQGGRTTAHADASAYGDDKGGAAQAAAKTASPERKSQAGKKEDAPPAGPVAKTYTGYLEKHYGPKGKSEYHSYTLKESPGEYLQTKDEDHIASLARIYKDGSKVELSVLESKSPDGKYTNRLITEIAVVGSDATEPEEGASN